MGLKSIDVVSKCHIHGKDVNTFELAGRLYCAKCLRNHLRRADVLPVKMTLIEEFDETETMICRHCGGERHVDDRPCAICGGDV